MSFMASPIIGYCTLCSIVCSAHVKWGSYQMRKIAGMPGTFSPSPWFSDPDIHPGTCVTHVPRCMPGSLTSGFHWSRCRGKHSWHSRRKQFCVSGKRPMKRRISMSVVLCVGRNPQETDGFPSWRASDAEYFSCHNVIICMHYSH